MENQNLIKRFETKRFETLEEDVRELQHFVAATLLTLMLFGGMCFAFGMGGLVAYIMGII